MLLELIYILGGLFFLIVFFLLKVSNQHIYHNLRTRDVAQGHSWCNANRLQTGRCSICDSLLLLGEGLLCSDCGLFADTTDCVTTANVSLKCKEISTTSPLNHHFVKGNLPSDSLCCVCKEECDMENSLHDVCCCWCQRCCHSSCLHHLAEVCDLGKLKELIVSPTNVKLHKSRLSKQIVIKEVVPSNVPNWSPIIIIGNCGSGSSECEYILPAFRRLLNPAQVIDLVNTSPEEALGWCQLLPSTTCRIIVAGGDGTIGWIFNTIIKLNLKNTPAVGIIPVGTGNDLSRVLGWGESYSSSLDAFQFLLSLNKAKIMKIDRWKVNFTAPRNYGFSMPARIIYMNNYLSVGVDALVTLNFHKTRQSPFYVFKSRLLNKLIYLTYGTKDVLMQECKNLQDIIELSMDGVKIDLPCFEALVVLNIPCWGAGVMPWKMGQGGEHAPEQKYDDRKLEVFCISSSFHIAQLQVGLTEPIRLGQCSTVEIHLKGVAPMQVDGEPWEQDPGTLSVKYSHSAKVLVNR